MVYIYTLFHTFYLDYLIVVFCQKARFACCSISDQHNQAIQLDGQETRENFITATKKSRPFYVFNKRKADKTVIFLFCIY